MHSRRFVFCASLAALVLSVAPSTLRAAPADEKFVGRWALTLPTGAGWLEVKHEAGWYDGSLLWFGGSVLPVSNVVVADGTLTVTRVRDVDRKDKKGQVVRKQQLTDTITAQAKGDTLTGVRLAPLPDGTGFERSEFTGKRIPPLPPRPDLKKVKFGPPISLFNGADLKGWKPRETTMPSAWSAEDGIIVNRPPPYGAGQPRVRTGNLRTEREFEDFTLKLDVNVPAGSNSGVYLRGIYEIQVSDSFGKPLDSHNMGALYSRLTPRVAAEKPAGEWQTLDLTLVDRHLTVVLNGKTIIDNEPILGCTGGALWSDEFRPGPIYLQGDHGPVSYRNLKLRPVMK